MQFFIYIMVYIDSFFIIDKEVLSIFMVISPYKEDVKFNVAHEIASERYPHKATFLSEPSGSYEDQIIFSYPFYRMVVCYDGEAEFHVIKDGNPTMILLERGDAVVVKPGAFIRSVNQKPYKTCGILLREQSIDFFTNDHLCRHRHRFMMPLRYVKEELHILFKQAADFSDNNKLLQQYAALIWTHIDEIIIKQNQPSGSHGTFLRVKSYVDKHFQFGINRKIVAAELGLNQDYLNALFHQFTGLSFTEYTIKIKLEKAKDILPDKSLSIAQVSKLCGFNSNTCFGRQFKKYYGMTPMVYRNSLKKL